MIRTDMHFANEQRAADFVAHNTTRDRQPLDRAYRTREFLRTAHALDTYRQEITARRTEPVTARAFRRRPAPVS